MYTYASTQPATTARVAYSTAVVALASGTAAAACMVRLLPPQLQLQVAPGVALSVAAVAWGVRAWCGVVLPAILFTLASLRRSQVHAHVVHAAGAPC